MSQLVVIPLIINTLLPIKFQILKNEKVLFEYLRPRFYTEITILTYIVFANLE